MEGFHVQTLKLPCRSGYFDPGMAFHGHRIQGILSMDKQKTVFSLDGGMVLSVRHNGSRLSEQFTRILEKGSGFVKSMETGLYEGYFYTIDEKLSPMPDIAPLSLQEQKQYAIKMLDAVRQVHDTGYCHLDIKPEHFGLRGNGEIKLIDPDSALPYTGRQHAGKIEYSPEFAAPEILHEDYGTESDMFSLGRSLQAMADGSNGLSALICGLTQADRNSRFNYTQALQCINGERVEANTGPRKFSKPKMVGDKPAYNDKQLARLLASDHGGAIRYVNKYKELGDSRDSEERLSSLIHRLDPSLPLYWNGVAYHDTIAIGRAMSFKYPEKDPIMIDLLKSGLLLKYSSLTSLTNGITGRLRAATDNPEQEYWTISSRFGGKGAPHEQESAAPSLTNAVNEREEINRLLNRMIKYGDPAAVARVILEFPQDTGISKRQEILQMLRAFPIDNGREPNITNVTLDNMFSSSITTELPSPEGIKENVKITDAFCPSRLYMVSPDAWNAWKQANREQYRLKRQRILAVLRFLGWAAVAVVFVLLLPYILTIVFIIFIAAIIIAFLSAF